MRIHLGWKNRQEEDTLVEVMNLSREWTRAVHDAVNQVEQLTGQCEASSKEGGP